MQISKSRMTIIVCYTISSHHDLRKGHSTNGLRNALLDWQTGLQYKVIIGSLSWETIQSRPPEEAYPSHPVQKHLAMLSIANQPVQARPVQDKRNSARMRSPSLLNSYVAPRLSVPPIAP